MELETYLERSVLDTSAKVLQRRMESHGWLNERMVAKMLSIDYPALVRFGEGSGVRWEVLM